MRVLAVAQVESPSRRRRARCCGKPSYGRPANQRARSRRRSGRCSANASAASRVARRQRRARRPTPRSSAQTRVVVGRVDDDRGEARWFLAAARIIVGPPMSMFSIDLRVAGVAAGDGLLERVEVHAHQVDRLDPLLGRRVAGARRRRGAPAGRREARVQRLHPAVQDLGEAGEVLDRAHLERPPRRARARCRRWRRSRRRAPPGRGRSRRPRSCRRPRSAPGARRTSPRGAVALDAAVRLRRDRCAELAVGEPCRRAYPSTPRIARSSTIVRRGFSGSSLARPRAISATASRQQLVLERVQRLRAPRRARARRAARPRAGGSPARCRRRRRRSGR